MIGPEPIREESAPAAEAAAWFVRLSNADAAAEDWRAFQEWLGSSRANAAAYERLERLSVDLDVFADDISQALGPVQSVRPPPRFDLSTWSGRAKAYADFVWNDHAWLRLGFQNAHWISDELVRTNQPWPHQLALWKAKGVRTVINLRGGSGGSCQIIEEAACRELGLTLVSFRAGSREAPSAAQVQAARELFDSIAYPALMHCKSGADRSGMMSVLYLHLRQGRPIREAIAQLGLRYLHWPGGETGILDYTFRKYLREGEAAGLDFLDWTSAPDYDPALIKAQYRAERTRLPVDALLRRE
jgi:protein tyrosine/serine phosphatase